MTDQGQRRHYPLWLIAGVLLLLALSGFSLYLLSRGPDGNGTGNAFGTPVARDRVISPDRLVRPEGPPPDVRMGSLGPPQRVTPPAAPPAETGDTVDQRLSAAREAAAREEWAEAIRIYDLLLAEAGADADLIAERARVLAWSGDNRGAAEGMAAALRARPGEVDWILEMARFHWWAGQYAEADAALAAYLGLRPGDSTALAIREEVRNAMEPSVELARGWLAEGETPLSHLWLARAYTREGRAAEALEHYRVATAGDALPDSLLLEFASVALTADSARVAAAAFEQFLWRNGLENREVRIQLARAYAWAGLHDKAIVTYRDLLAVGDDPQLRFELAQLYAWTDNERLAEEELGRVLAVRPGHAASLRLLGDLARWRGELALAAERYRAALESAPDDEEVRTALREVEAALAAQEAEEVRTIYADDEWLFGADGFRDNLRFNWIAALGSRRWGVGAGALTLSVQEGFLSGPRRLGGDFSSLVTGAQLEARLPLANGWSLGVEGGLQHFTKIGTFPTWGSRLEWGSDAERGFTLGYTRQPAVQVAQTTAALGAEMVNDAVRLQARHALGAWSFTADLIGERFDSQLGQIGRGAGSIVLCRELTPSFSIRGIVRSVFSDRLAPVFTDWGSVVWTPRYFVMPGAQLAYQSQTAGRWAWGARVGAGYAFVEERDFLDIRYETRTTVVDAGLDLGYQLGKWRLSASGDWSGAVPRGYRAGAFRLRLTLPGAPR